VQHYSGQGPRITLSLQEWETRKKFVNFTSKDEQALIGLRSKAEAYSGPVIEALYSWITQFPEAASYFPDSATLQRAKRAQSQYFTELTAGSYGDNYMQGRIRVGETHARLNLTTQWYMGMYGYYMSLIIPYIVDGYKDNLDGLKEALQAIMKLMMLDSELALYAYSTRREMAIEEMNRANAEKEKALTDARLRDAEEQAQAVNEAIRVLSNMAVGDLTSEMQGSYQGHLATLQAELSRTQETLRGMVSQIREASHNVARASSEIASASFDLSRRTEAQAANLEQTAATAEELTSIVRQNAENAQRAASLGVANRNEATKGAKVVQRTIEAMGDIKESSKKIADIIGTVDEIAFQTNILALNAAVEAARAGDQGRGFAVVAAEVRNLAQRSAAAAKEIKTLIRNSVERVEDGSVAVTESGKTLQEIEAAAERVNELIRDMATSSHEQQSGVEQVSAAVVEMEQVTQQNAAMVEETVASAESLDTQANTLRVLMDYFRIGNEGPQHGHAQAAQQTRVMSGVTQGQRLGHGADTGTRMMATRPQAGASASARPAARPAAKPAGGMMSSAARTGEYAPPLQAKGRGQAGAEGDADGWENF
jgi:methyl-accepting chemotaxis protein